MSEEKETKSILVELKFNPISLPERKDEAKMLASTMAVPSAAALEVVSLSELFATALKNPKLNEHPIQVLQMLLESQINAALENNPLGNLLRELNRELDLLYGAQGALTDLLSDVPQLDLSILDNGQAQVVLKLSLKVLPPDSKKAKNLIRGAYLSISEFLPLLGSWYGISSVMAFLTGVADFSSISPSTVRFQPNFLRGGDVYPTRSFHFFLCRFCFASSFIRCCL